MRVNNMVSSSGNTVKNQYMITDGKGNIFFQSYDTMIAKKCKNGQIQLDEKYWNHSNTTSKYRNIFLNETTKDTKKKIKDKTYKLVNLNK